MQKKIAFRCSHFPSFSIHVPLFMTIYCHFILSFSSYILLFFYSDLSHPLSSSFLFQVMLFYTSTPIVLINLLNAKPSISSVCSQFSYSAATLPPSSPMCHAHGESLMSRHEKDRHHPRATSSLFEAWRKFSCLSLILRRTWSPALSCVSPAEDVYVSLKYL